MSVVLHCRLRRGPVILPHPPGPSLPQSSVPLVAGGDGADRDSLYSWGERNVLFCNFPLEMGVNRVLSIAGRADHGGSVQHRSGRHTQRPCSFQSGCWGGWNLAGCSGEFGLVWLELQMAGVSVMSSTRLRRRPVLKPRG